MSFPTRQTAAISLLHVVTLVAGLGAAGLLSPSADARAEDENAALEWIWSDGTGRDSDACCLQTSFEVTQGIQSASLFALLDYSNGRVFLNSEPVAATVAYDSPVELDVTEHIKRGMNSLSVCAIATDGPSAIGLRLVIRHTDGTSTKIDSSSRSGWVNVQLPENFQPLLDPPPQATLRTKTSIRSLGPIGRQYWAPGGSGITIQPSDNYEQWKLTQNSTLVPPAESFSVADGFQVELVCAARENEGSWISLAFDPEGRLIIAVEKKGLLRLSPPYEDSDDARPQVINKSLQECRGLLYAHDALYAMANNDRALFRLTNSADADDLGQVEKLLSIPGDVGHGRNEMVLGPDGRIYAICGDAAFEPDNATSLPPMLSSASDIEKTRSGFVVAFDPDGKKPEIIARGLRNPYGIDFNAIGDMFTYDADAEHDMGSPWYRPTRIDHIVPGGDFGWRRVTGRWPAYSPDRPDMPQPTVDIGKGSPTSVAFARGDHFPSHYRNTLFALDWAYGRILAVHLSERGSSYSAVSETFLRGSPANVCDIEFSPDGRMYFVTGGRGTQSAIYRVSRSESLDASQAETPQADLRRKHAAASRVVRRELESHLGQPSADALELAWTNLDHPDPWIRHAARAVLEWQPSSEWKTRVAASEVSAAKRIAATLAATRSSDSQSALDLAKDCLRLDFATLSTDSQLSLLFIYDRLLSEWPDNQSAAEAMLEQLDSHYLMSSPRVVSRLGHFLLRLESATLRANALTRLADTSEQRARMDLLLILSEIGEGWSDGDREEYFAALTEMIDYQGGAGMPDFRERIYESAIGKTPKDSRAGFEAVLTAPARNRLSRWAPNAERQFVRSWKANDIAELLDRDPSLPTHSNGRLLIREAGCLQCHHVGSEGGTQGPDLTSVGRRFTPADILTSIIEPSQVVAPKYRQSIFALKDGRVVTGRVESSIDYRSPTIRVQTDLTKLDQFVEFKKDDIEEQRESTESQMPARLLDSLSADEIRQLLAYLVAAGDPEHPIYRKR